MNFYQVLGSTAPKNPPMGAGGVAAWLSTILQATVGVSFALILACVAAGGLGYVGSHTVAMVAFVGAAIGCIATLGYLFVATRSLGNIRRVKMHSKNS